MKITKIFLVLFSLVLIIGCKESLNIKDDPIDDVNEHASQSFDLYVDYWNPGGQNPQISFDEELTDPAIKIDFEYAFGGFVFDPNLIDVVFDNVRIIDENNVNYQIDDITTSEYREDLVGWVEDAEFAMQYQLVEDVDIVMVLDVSGSLGNNFDKVKSYASDFVDRILTEMPGARISIISFSDVIHSNTSGLTNDQVALNDFIDNMQQGQFTKLYDAMSLGIDMLNFEQTTSKVLLTFTDGVDNYSTPLITPEHIALKLGTPLGNNARINSFIIGLDGNGNIDIPVLEYLTANGGIAEFPPTVDDLGRTFITFARSITNVYNFSYIRNQQLISISDAISLRFRILTSPE